MDISGGSNPRRYKGLEVINRLCTTSNGVVFQNDPHRLWFCPGPATTGGGFLQFSPGHELDSARIMSEIKSRGILPRGLPRLQPLPPQLSSTHQLGDVAPLMEPL